MNNQFASENYLFQDRQFVESKPTSAWHRLTAGDEKAEAFEEFLRTALVVSLVCAVLICAFRLRPATSADEQARYGQSAVQLQDMIGRAPAAVKAGIRSQVVRSTSNLF